MSRVARVVQRPEMERAYLHIQKSASALTTDTLSVCQGTTDTMSKRLVQRPEMERASLLCRERARKQETYKLCLYARQGKMAEVCTRAMGDAICVCVLHRYKAEQSVGDGRSEILGKGANC
jgi:hypothetical protein